LSDMIDVKEAILQAIQMEKDGYAFYKRAAAQTSSETGSRIFESLAKDEQLHLATFQKLFEDQIQKSEYDKLVNSSRKYATLPVFPKNLTSKEGANPDTNDLDALNAAMNSEKEAIEYYTQILDKTEGEDARNIIKEIIHQETSHYFILEEEFDFLGRTGYWYDSEHLSLEY
jgi:rubrerythrin